MSDHDHDHVEPQNPVADAVANRWFAVGITGILAFIAVVFGFIIINN